MVADKCFSVPCRLFHAHSGKAEGRADWQRLADHLLAVARRAESHAAAFGLGRIAFAAGLFHDLGKYDPAFQAYIGGQGASVDHSTAGAQVLRDLARGPERLVAEIIAYAILGHHAGLPDRQNETNACLDTRMAKPLRVDETWQTELAPDGTRCLEGTVAELKPFVLRDAGKRAFALSFVGRMIFSCLVDADFKDTESYYVSLGEAAKDRCWPELPALLPGFLARFEARIAAFGRPETGIAALRADILAQVRAGASREPGLFSLTVPTGGGKTLASLGFAIDHARQHGKSRIIYAIPFTSIIDQTAAIFRDVLGDEHVLEHHSNIDEEDIRKREHRDKLKLAMEDWAAPVIVTTTVQLFESLFSARPSRARKLHNIANSILILDEAQTLPRPLLLPVMRALEELVARYGCSVVLCTATQPMLGVRPEFPQGLPLQADRELAPDPEGLARQLARTHIRHAGTLDDAALVDRLGAAHQMLVIVNSRRHAMDLFNAAREAGLDGLVHLTTRHHATDRRRILEGVRHRLATGAACRLIATSLIEAGVDVDFPAGLRAEAGLDQIIQAAGRVNREGRQARGDSILAVFTPAEHKPPREIAGLIGDMKRIIDRHPDLTAPAAMADYYAEVYWRVRESGLDAKSVLDNFSLAPSGTDFCYRKAGDDFRMIESGLVPVIIAIEAEAQDWVRKLSLPDVPGGLLARKLQSFTVQVPPKARARLVACGHVAFVAPELRGDQFAVLQKPSLYDPQLGLIWEDAEYLATEDLIW